MLPQRVSSQSFPRNDSRLSIRSIRDGNPRVPVTRTYVVEMPRRCVTSSRRGQVSLFSCSFWSVFDRRVGWATGTCIFCRGLHRLLFEYETALNEMHHTSFPSDRQNIVFNGAFKFAFSIEFNIACNAEFVKFGLRTGASQDLGDFGTVSQLGQSVSQRSLRMVLRKASMTCAPGRLQVMPACFIRACTTTLQADSTTPQTQITFHRYAVPLLARQLGN